MSKRALFLFGVALLALAAAAFFYTNQFHMYRITSSRDDGDALAPCNLDPSFGTFPAPPRLIPDPSSSDADYLDADFVFIDSDGIEWVALASAQTRDWSWDGSSIPVALAVLMGTPKTGCHRLASVHHDCYYQTAARHDYTRKEVDRLFYAGLRAGGVGWTKAKVMYYAVRAAGQMFWKSARGLADDASLELSALPEQDQVDVLRAVERLIEAENPALDELDVLDPSGDRVATYRGD